MLKGIVRASLILSLFAVPVKASSIIADIALQGLSIQNLIDWKIGEKATYDMDLGFLGKGSVVKEATKEEGNALWISTKAKTPLGEQTADVLIRREDGKILKFIVDGKEQEYKEPELELISREADEITVPAGTFKTIHIKAKDKSDDADIDMWANPVDVPLGGIVKNIVVKGFLTITMVLKSFSKV
ncbi:MAG: hypothetical protein A3B70_08140 [Deltaproteobacteria bacterium RIFCSPHIGHO2_02_FULL_40_11]|nr:MAG: hypothetical protein A3B70_08140 [Deltaproteobacteria bacterium RIFCSPHIGHO2_02_FULL_40_11]